MAIRPPHSHINEAVQPKKCLKPVRRSQVDADCAGCVSHAAVPLNKSGVYVIADVQVERERYLLALKSVARANGRPSIADESGPIADAEAEEVDVDEVNERGVRPGGFGVGDLEGQGPSTREREVPRTWACGKETNDVNPRPLPVPTSRTVLILVGMGAR
ncbi:hypothetical protein MMC27_003742 [Xylographa pallens]|nr:hypothetical protein [Xylographa pallens]